MNYSRIKKIDLEQVKPVVQQAIREDLGKTGDITTQLVVDEAQKVKARIISRQEGILAGIDIAGLVFKTVNSRVKFKPVLRDGTRFASAQIIAEISGPAQGILTAERTALNFLGTLSGIATLTAEFVKKVHPYPVKILDTRKTVPNLRYLEKYAVCCGGGYNHRMGLYDQVLIKDNHIEVFRKSTSRVEAISLILKNLRKKKPKGIRVEIEVETLEELVMALAEQPDIIMLDNMNLRQIKKAVVLRNRLYPEIKKKRPLLEVSGGVTMARVAKLAACGVDLISVGALTHSSKAIDFSLEIET